MERSGRTERSDRASDVCVCPDSPMQVNGYRAYCDVWATDDQAGLVLASFLGPVTVVKSVWAQLLGGRSVELPDYKWLWCDKDAKYHRSIERFPGIEQAHLVLVHESATLQVRQGEKAYLVASSPDGDRERFFGFWNRAIPLPARPAWAEYLWESGLNLYLIRNIACYGCHAWSIDPDPVKWGGVIKAGIRSGEIC